MQWQHQIDYPSNVVQKTQQHLSVSILLPKPGSTTLFWLKVMEHVFTQGLPSWAQPSPHIPTWSLAPSVAPRPKTVEQLYSPTTKILFHWAEGWHQHAPRQHWHQQLCSSNCGLHLFQGAHPWMPTRSPSPHILGNSMHQPASHTYDQTTWLPLASLTWPAYLLQLPSEEGWALWHTTWASKGRVL